MRQWERSLTSHNLCDNDMTSKAQGATLVAPDNIPCTSDNMGVLTQLTLSDNNSLTLYLMRQDSAQYVSLGIKNDREKAEHI